MPLYLQPVVDDLGYMRPSVPNPRTEKKTSTEPREEPFDFHNLTLKGSPKCRISHL